MIHVDATLSIVFLVSSLGWRSQRHDMDFELCGSSPKPYTVVRIPAMWRVFDEIRGGVEWVSERGL